MTIARTGDGSLAVHSAIACDEATMAAIDALGELRTIVVPSGLHRIDAPAYQARYPGARVLAMPASQRKVARAVAVDGGYELLPRGDELAVEPLAGVAKEAALVHRAADGETLIFNDALMNLPRALPGWKGFLVKLVDETGALDVTRTARIALVDDKRAYATCLRALAARPSLRRIVPGHGALVLDDAAAQLHAAADRLHRE